MNSQEDFRSDYIAYLLRMWRKKDGSGRPVWCASLQEPGSGNMESFGDMSALFAFLQGRLGIEIPCSAAIDAPAPSPIDSGQQPPPGPPDGQ